MTKKISILTFFFSHNYGAVLQAYAMSKLLMNEGCDVEFVDLRTHSANIKLTIPKSPRDLFMIYKYFSIKLFISKYFPSISQPIKTLDQLKNRTFNSDAFLVGSDQVWGLKHTGNSYKAFFLDFVPNEIPKIAFAASFGISEWDNSVGKEITEEVELLLKRFNYIGVREKTGVEICQKTFNVEAKHVLDPTLLLDDFDNLAGKIQKKRNQEIFRYFIHQNTELNKEVENVTKIVSDFSNIYKFNNIKFIKYKNPKQWLRKIASSALIITDSFHVCCFSIIFRKPFIVLITKKSVSTRITSLLSDLGLSDRIVYSSVELNQNLCWQQPIDFDKVHSKLQKMRLESFTELRKALKCINLNKKL